MAINLSAAAEKLGGDPSYRPRIQVPWLVSLAGSLGAVSVMFLISPMACVIAITLELVLYSYLRQRALRRRWGDARAGVWMSLARMSLLRLRDHGEEVVFVDNNPDACHVVERDSFRVVYGNPLQERTLQRAMLEDRASCIAVTISDEINFMLGRQAANDYLLNLPYGWLIIHCRIQADP